MTKENINNEELIRRLKELEEENNRLKKKSKEQKNNILIIKEGEYMGHPVLTFEGKCRPFTLGLKKLCIIKEAWPKVEKFLESKMADEAKFQDNNDIKI